jgi:hypothetical protein
MHISIATVGYSIVATFVYFVLRLVYIGWSTGVFSNRGRGIDITSIPWSYWQLALVFVVTLILCSRFAI